MAVLPLNRKLIHLIVVLLAFATIGSACSIESRIPPPATAKREVTDEAGRRVRVPLRSMRIVSLAPNLTEIVFAIGAGDRLVGNTTFCDFPEEANRVPKVGDTQKPNLENIIAQRPDLILVSTSSQLESFTRELDDRGIAVYVTDPKSLDAVFTAIAQIGDLLGGSERAQKLVGELRARTAAVERAVAGRPTPRVFYQLSGSPLYTAGRDSFVTDLIRRAGGDSVTKDVPTAWPTFNAESALASRPDVIVIPTADSMGDGNLDVAPALKRSPAVLNDRVLRIHGDYLSRPGPRLVEGLERLARGLHPEAFQ